MTLPTFHRGAHGGRYPQRLADPATSEAEYTAAEWEFMRAMDRYKRLNNRPFPTWREVYHVFLALGYRKDNRYGMG